MRLSEFILLHEGDKKSTLLHEGVMIDKRIAGKLMIFLFQLDGFYVEAFGDPASRDFVEYRVFSGTLLLQPYLDKLCIKDVFPAG